MQLDLFQTLPGVILHFYKQPAILENGLPEFQTLPGVILHFYNKMTPHCIKGVMVSNPSRGYSTFLPPGAICPNATNIRFKPFQGLFYISTRLFVGWYCSIIVVSNPSRGYSTFLLFDSRKINTAINGFKPFQGLFYISTQEATSCAKTPVVSNPSRGYSTFLRLLYHYCL